MKYSGLNYAFYLLGKRDRSVGEIKAKMTEKKFAPTEIDSVIKTLKDKKFLDDEKFARHFIKNQISIKPIGKFKLAAKLKQKFIAAEIIEAALAEILNDEKALAEKAAEKKYQTLKTKYQDDKDKIREALARHLGSRGFGWDVIKEIID